MRHFALTAAAAAVAAFVMPAAQAGYTFTTGAEYTSGDYGTGITTTSWYIPFTLGYTGKDYALSVTVPYVSVDGSTEVTASSSYITMGPGGIKTHTMTTSSSDERTDSGLGDVVLKASYQFQTETRNRPWMGVTGKVKLGTASTKDNLGTGEDDYGVQLDMAKGPVDGFIGYMLLGDTNAVNYDDIFYGAIGYSMKLQQNWSMRAEYYAEQEAIDGADPVQEVSLALGKPLNKQQRLKLYAIKGLTDSSPDWGAGVMVSTSF